MTTGALSFPTPEQLGIPEFDPRTGRPLTHINALASAARGGLMRGLPAFGGGGIIPFNSPGGNSVRSAQFPTASAILGGNAGGGNGGGSNAGGPGGENGYGFAGPGQESPSFGGPGVGAFGHGSSPAAGDTSAGMTTDGVQAALNAAAFAMNPGMALVGAFSNAELGRPGELGFTGMISQAISNALSWGQGGISAEGALGPTGAIGSMAPDAAAAAMGEDLPGFGSASNNGNALAGGAGVGGPGGFGSSTGTASGAGLGANAGEAGPSGMGASAGDTGGATCYITTAAVDHMGLKDDGPELSTLRNFRDNVMERTPQGRAMVAEYQAVAPHIVKEIDKLPNAKSVYRSLYQNHIAPAVQAAQDGDDAAALEHYGSMVKQLESAFPQAKKRGGMIKGGALESAKSAGRYGDTELLHVSKPELGALASTGKLTRNPKTGLPEAFSFGDIWGSVAPIVGGIAGGALGGPFGSALGAGLGTVASGGSWRDALLTSAIGFGGSYLANGMPSFDSMGNSFNSGLDRIGSGVSGIGSEAPTTGGVTVATDNPTVNPSSGDSNAAPSEVSAPSDGPSGGAQMQATAPGGGLTGAVSAGGGAAAPAPALDPYANMADPYGVPTKAELDQAAALNSATTRAGIGNDVMDALTTKKALLGIGAGALLGGYGGNQREAAAKAKQEAEDAAKSRQALFSNSSAGTGSLFNMPQRGTTRLNLSVDPYHVGERGNQGYVYAQGGLVPSYGFGGRVMPPGFANKPAALGRVKHLPVQSDQLRFRSALGGGQMKGAGDGQSDSIPARVADGEYVIPADVVSHIGNGSTDAGGRALDQTVKKIRKQRTGNTRFPPRVNPGAALAGVTS